MEVLKVQVGQVWEGCKFVIFLNKVPNKCTRNGCYKIWIASHLSTQWCIQCKHLIYDKFHLSNHICTCWWLQWKKMIVNTVSKLWTTCWISKNQSKLCKWASELVIFHHYYSHRIGKLGGPILHANIFTGCRYQQREPNLFSVVLPP